MNIFHNIDPADSLSAVENAVKAILRRRDERSLSKPWSSSELAPDEEDFKFFVRLLRKADESAIERSLRPQRAKEFGLIFLCFAAEVARRFASEGEVWSVISKCFNEATSRPLFSANSQPKQLLKDAIETAARHYEMRHVFGTAGVLSWYQTIYLQFGFTKNGFGKRLPEWLVGQSLPEAIAALSNDERLQSQSFRSLWQTLRSFRRNNITEQAARKELALSSWILPAWIEELLKVARQRPDLPDRPTGEFCVEAKEPKFLSDPRLDWVNGALRFSSEVTNLAQLNALSDKVYELRIGNDRLANLVRQPDGGYATDTETVELCCVPTFTAALVSHRFQETKYSQIIELWNPDDDITLFSACGKRLDAWNERLRSDKTYYILAVDDLVLTPEMAWHCVAERWKLHELPTGWPPDAKLTFEDGDTLWTPLLGAAAQSEPTWAKSCSLVVASVYEKDAKVRVNVSPEVTVRFVRCGLPLDFDNNHCTVPLTSFGMTGAASLRIGLQRGDEKCVVKRQVSLDDGLRDPLVLTLGDDGWRKLDDDKISSAAAKRVAYKFFLPKSWDGEDADWVLMEGDVCLGKPSHSSRPLRELAGFGAALTLRPRLYNVGGKAVEVSKKVVAYGCVEGFAFDEAKRVGSICFRQRLEPSDEFAVVAWTQTGNLHFLSVDAYDEDSMRWECVVSDDFANPVAVAVAFCGEWMGVWVRRKANEWLPHLLDSPHLGHRLKAALLRWFHLPLLSRKYCSNIRKFAETHPVETITAWLRNTLVELPCGLKFADRDDAWLSVVRTMFRDWQPQSEEAKAFFEVCMEKSETPMSAIGDAFDALLRVDPRLAVKVMRVGCPQHSNLLRFRIACAGDDATYQCQKSQLVETCSKEMRCDTAFLKSLLEKAAEDTPSANKRDAVNLATAIVASSDFRKLLAMHLLECVA